MVAGLYIFFYIREKSKQEQLDNSKEKNEGKT